MPPSSVLSTRYRTARRYPVISRGSTTLCDDVSLLLARCCASASAGATVKWYQFYDERVRAGYYATREEIRVWQCGRPEILVSSESRVTHSKTDRLAVACLRMCVGWCFVQNIDILCSKTDNKIELQVISTRGKVNSCYDKSLPDSSVLSYPEHRSFNISAAAERKQQNAVTRSRRPL